MFQNDSKMLQFGDFLISWFHFYYIGKSEIGQSLMSKANAIPWESGKTGSMTRWKKDSPTLRLIVYPVNVDCVNIITWSKRAEFIFRMSADRGLVNEASLRSCKRI